MLHHFPKCGYLVNITDATLLDNQCHKLLVNEQSYREING